MVQELSIIPHYGVHPMRDGVRPRGCVGCWALTYHLVVAVLRREVQRDLPIQRGHVDGGSGSQQHPHGLHAPLPGCVVQGPHPCRKWGSAGMDAAPSPARGGCWGHGAVPGGWGHPLPLLSLMSTVACASSSSEMRSRLPPRAAWCSAENLRHKAGLSPAPSPPRCPYSPCLHSHTGLVTGWSWPHPS